MDISILTSTGSQRSLSICSSTATLDQRKGKIGYVGNVGFGFRRNGCTTRLHAITLNGFASPYASLGTDSTSTGDVHRKRSSLESLFCYDKPIPEEIIEKPVGVSLAEKAIGSNLRCSDCQAKGAVLCATCSGSGLYVDSILESQGIIVKVRCLGCGGTGNIMCSECGGRGHLGPK